MAQAVRSQTGPHHHRPGPCAQEAGTTDLDRSSCALAGAQYPVRVSLAYADDTRTAGVASSPFPPSTPRERVLSNDRVCLRHAFEREPLPTRVRDLDEGTSCRRTARTRILTNSPARRHLATAVFLICNADTYRHTSPFVLYPKHCETHPTIQSMTRVMSWHRVASVHESVPDIAVLVSPIESWNHSSPLPSHVRLSQDVGLLLWTQA